MRSSLPPIVARADLYETRTAMVEGNRTFSYHDLRTAGRRLSARLLGVGADLNEERVAFLIPPSVDHVAVLWGIWSAGGIAVPLPIGHPLSEIDYLVRDAEATTIVSDLDSVDQLAPIAKAIGARLLTTQELLEPGLAGLQPSTTNDLVTVGPGFSPTLIAPERRALMLYTSGTTGRPKGVVTTHANVTAQIESLVTAWEWAGGDRTLLVLPLHHVHGIINVVSCALWSGAVLEILPRFDAEAAWDRLASGEITVFSAVPTIYHRLIRSWEAAAPAVQQARSRGCHAIRLMMSGSSALPRTVLDRWKDITGHVLLERYGMTEVGMALSNPLHGERRPGFVGQPLPGVSVRLVDGELQLKGPGVFAEYWRRPDSTREAFCDGWFRTGDVALVQDGAYRLLGRASIDIIKSGGDKMSALEIEETLRSHPAILECAVVGVDDAEWGQRVCAAVELRPGRELTLQDLREWARARMAPHKIPRELMCVAQLPRNAMGKIVKPGVATFFTPAVPPARQEP